MFRVILLTVALSASCARRDPRETTTETTTVAEKFETYSKLRGGVDAFVAPGTCDSLLFSGLLGSTGDAAPDIEQFRESAGVWWRRPVANGNCYPGESPSQISRDMLLGLIRWIWKKGRLDLIEELITYLEENDYVAGPGDLSRTVVTPSLFGTMLWIQAELGGEDDSRKDEVLAKLFYSGKEPGFTMHLAAIHMDLRAELVGSMGEGHYQILEKYAERVSRNPLFAALLGKWSDGDQGEATRLLLDEEVWPNDAAPTSANYCADWPIQREKDSDWDPCPERGETHDTAPWLFVAGIVLGL